MPEITEAQLEEYNRLKQLAVFNSAQAFTDRLEDDIDKPVKRLVMMLALLGCEPVWSCCGFDYYDQPVHKSHERGSTGFRLKDNSRSRALAELIKSDPPMYSRYANLWQCGHWEQYSNSFYTLRADLDKGNTWPDPTCIHHSEPGVIAIATLEHWLMGFEKQFAKRVVLEDSNAVFQKRFPQWQYPAKKAWVIRKKDLEVEQ